MRLYSDFAAQRTRQLVGDAAALVFLLLAILLGVTAYGAIAAVGDYGTQIAQSGSGFESTMTDIGQTLEGVPLIGGSIRAPFDGASDAGGALAQAGRDVQQSIESLATAVGWSIALVALALVLLIRTLPRLRWARRASRTARVAASAGGIDLLALRALGNADPADVLAAVPDPADAWRSRDPRALQALAAVAARESGIRLRQSPSV